MAITVHHCQLLPQRFRQIISAFGMMQLTQINTTSQECSLQIV